MLHLDTYIFAILDEIRLDILTTIFRSKDLDFPPRLVLNQGLENLEVVKNFRLDFKEVNPTIPIKVIYEGNDILGFNHGNMMERNNNITMDGLKRCRGSLMTDSLILILWIFS